MLCLRIIVNSSPVMWLTHRLPWALTATWARIRILLRTRPSLFSGVLRWDAGPCPDVVYFALVVFAGTFLPTMPVRPPFPFDLATPLHGHAGSCPTCPGLTSSLRCGCSAPTFLQLVRHPGLVNCFWRPNPVGRCLHFLRRSRPMLFVRSHLHASDCHTPLLSRAGP